MSAVECEALAVALEALLPNGGSPSEVADALLPLLAQVKATARAEALEEAATTVRALGSERCAEAVRALDAPEEARCQHVSPSPWGPTQCALPLDHEERHAYSPSESIEDGAQ